MCHINDGLTQSNNQLWTSNLSLNQSGEFFQFEELITIFQHMENKE